MDLDMLSRGLPKLGSLCVHIYDLQRMKEELRRAVGRLPQHGGKQNTREQRQYDDELGVVVPQIAKFTNLHSLHINFFESTTHDFTHHAFVNTLHVRQGGHYGTTDVFLIQHVLHSCTQHPFPQFAIGFRVIVR